jgi:hypothetical protein
MPASCLPRRVISSPPDLNLASAFPEPVSRHGLP